MGQYCHFNSCHRGGEEGEELCGVMGQVCLESVISGIGGVWAPVPVHVGEDGQ